MESAQKTVGRGEIKKDTKWSSNDKSSSNDTAGQVRDERSGPGGPGDQSRQGTHRSGGCPEHLEGSRVPLDLWSLAGVLLPRKVVWRKC